MVKVFVFISADLAPLLGSDWHREESKLRKAVSEKKQSISSGVQISAFNATLVSVFSLTPDIL